MRTNILLLFWYSAILISRKSLPGEPVGGGKALLGEREAQPVLLLQLAKSILTICIWERETVV